MVLLLEQTGHQQQTSIYMLKILLEVLVILCKLWLEQEMGREPLSTYLRGLILFNLMA